MGAGSLVYNDAPEEAYQVAEKFLKQLSL